MKKLSKLVINPEKMMMEGVVALKVVTMELVPLGCKYIDGETRIILGCVSSEWTCDYGMAWMRARVFPRYESNGWRLYRHSLLVVFLVVG